ncbi:MAG: 6-pyruvoyl trahydropterin synthase family protein [Methermicoccaceae archaeon]
MTFVELDGWMAKLRFSSCHLIPGHPSCGHLHGHTYAVSVRVEGELEGEFLVDFIELKGFVKDICDMLDHRVLIASKDYRLKISVEPDECYKIMIGSKRYVLPKEDVVLVPIQSIAAEHLCAYIADELAENLREIPGLKVLHVRVDEGMGQGAGCALKL